MSGLAVIYERSNTPVDSGVLERMMERLSHRGPDGRNIKIDGAVGMGCWYFWSTPEETGETQPLKLAGLPYSILMDGRLDNRTELFNQLKIEPNEARHISDATLVLKCYARWAEACFKELVGEFALLIYDETRRELICLRDALGDRTLFYAIRNSRVVIASEPWAVAAGLGGGVELDDRAVAYHFALQVPEDGQTLFKGIFELMPAQYLKINPNGDTRQIYWQPKVLARNLKRSDADYADEFRTLLDESVRCRLRSTTPAAVMMSGGLDSTSVACLAARIRDPEILTTVSYVFDKFPDCDERVYINAIRDQYGTRSIQIPCDDLWPFKDSGKWPLNPNWPHPNPYRLILERTYTRAKDEGIKVMLTGMYGDNLYLGSEDFLADALIDKRIGRMGREVQYLINSQGVKRTLNSRVFRRIIKRLLLLIFGDNAIRRKYTAPEWLTPFSASHLKVNLPKPSEDRRAEILSLNLAAGNSSEFYNTNRFGLELRVPYRDRRLVEYALSLPSYMLVSEGIKKYILRIAMAGILPETIRIRSVGTNLLSFYNNGLQLEKNVLRECFLAGDAAWKKYVRREFVMDEWETVITSHNDGPNAVIPSLCFFFDLWYKSQNALWKS